MDVFLFLLQPDRPSFHSSGISHPISPLYAYQNFVEHTQSKNGNSQCPVSKAGTLTFSFGSECDSIKYQSTVFWLFLKVHKYLL